MAIHEEGVIEHQGQAKELDSGAIDMILDNVQISQYVYPVKSTVRELGSNGEDSIKEKNTAIAILTGKAKVEDYYYVPGKNKVMDEAIKANPDIYKDSRFDPDYYNLDCLSPINKVQMVYRQNDNKSKDVLTVRDWGVGLGDYRLHGYLKIGYSTKRLLAKALGKWGLGAKAPLSMGVPYYTMTSVHNHRKFKMQIYSRHWQSIVPHMDSLGIPNDFINFYKKDGSIVPNPDGTPLNIHYEWTDEQNYTEIAVDCKKHYITDVKNAVQSQLLYFSNVEFAIINEANEREEVVVQAPILYEDESLILSDNDQYSKPHIVINNVSYGYINFEELELEQSRGNIGIKVVSGEIDVTPNRENVIWNDTTREVVLKRFKQASRAAKRIIMESFVQTNFKEWLGACVGVFGYGSSLNGDSPEVKALKELQNIAKVKGATRPEFVTDPRIRYSGYLPNMFPGLNVRLVQKKYVKRKKGTVEEIVRMEIYSVSNMFSYPMYLQGINASNKRDEYLLSQHPEGFLLVRDTHHASTSIDDSLETELSDVEGTNDIVISDDDKEFVEQVKRGSFKETENDWRITNPLILEGVPKYEDVVLVETPETIEEERLAKETLEQKRKREQRIVVQTPRGSDLTWHKVEPRIEVLDSIRKEFYWGNNDDKDGVLLAAEIVGKSHSSKANALYTARTEEEKVRRDDYWQKVGISDVEGNVYDTWAAAQLAHWGDPDTKVMLGIIAKDNVRYVQDNHFHITEFYNRFQDGVLTMADALIRWNTGRIINGKIGSLRFLEGMANIDNARYTQYQELIKYIKDTYTHVNPSNLKDAIIEHLDKVQLLQDAFRESTSDDNVYALSVAQELFGLEVAQSSIVGAIAVDMAQLDKLNELLVWASTIKDMLNMINALTNSYSTLNLEQEEAIRQYVQWRTA